MSVADPPRADASGRGAAFSGATGGEELTVVEPLIFERSRPERRAVRFPQPSDVARERASRQPQLPASVLRKDAPRLPEVSELELLRHYNRLAHLNQAIDLNFYPLGSCTMKYNPKVNEWAARLPGLAESHPLDPEALSQGSLELMWLLAELLKEISGFGAVSLQPAAGAHGELTGMLMTRAYHRDRGEGESAHEGARAGLGARHEPGDGHDGRLPDGHDPLERARRDRPRVRCARRSGRTWRR